MADQHITLRGNPDPADVASDCWFAEQVGREELSGLHRTVANRVHAPAAFQSMMEGLNDMAALIAGDGTILAANKRWIGHVHEDERKAFLRVGRNYFELLSRLAAQGATGALEILRGLSSLSAGKDEKIVVHYARTEGSRKQRLKITLSSVVSEGERMILVTAQDMRELIKLKRQRRRLGSHLLRAQEDERRRFARDLHDSVQQSLVGLKFNLMRLQDKTEGASPNGLVADCAKTIDNVQREIRAFSFVRHPPSLREGFEPAIRRLVEGFGRRAKLALTIDLEEVGESAPAVEATIYRLVQEALVGIHQDPAATELSVSVVGTDRYLHLLLRTDSRELDVASVDQGGDLGVGIGGMIDRLEHLGGRLRVRRLAEGSSLTASLPRRLLE